MSVYRPKRNGEVSKFYVCEFVIHGKRIQESTGTTSKTVAKEYEKRRRAEFERAAAGLPTVQKANRIRTVSEVVSEYLNGYALNHRRNSVLFVTSRLRHIRQLLGDALLSDLTEARIKIYIRERRAKGASGRTINMEIGELSRAVGRTWRELWPRVKKLEERKDVGRALSPEEQCRILDAVESSQSVTLRTLIPILLLTDMRSGEAMSLVWGQVNLISKAITVGRAKTSSGTGRLIPINDELVSVLLTHRAWFAGRFGEPKAEHHLFPWGSPEPCDPSRHVTGLKRAWSGIRSRAGLSCRLHDLRHTFATGLTELGTSEGTMLALMGHMSRSMLERYSHIRMAAKRDAISALTLRRANGTSEEVPVKVPVITENTHLQ